MSKIRYYSSYLFKHIDSNYWDETYIHNNSDSDDRIYYIIRRSNKLSGLFSNYIFVLGHIKYAFENGWVPAVDMQNYPNSYTNPECLGVENSWNFFFEQPTQIENIDSIYKKRNIVLSSGESRDDMPTDEMSFLLSSENISYWRRLSKKIPLKDDVIALVKDEWNKLFGSEDRKVLGVLLRGTDYLKLRPLNHPVQPNLNDAVEMIDSMESNFEYIYLTTEDPIYIKALKNKYGNKLIYSDVQRYDNYKDGYLSKIKGRRKDYYYKKGIDYLMTMGVLSKCNALVGGRTSGTIAILIMDNNFSEVKLFDKGRY